MSLLPVTRTVHQDRTAPAEAPRPEPSLDAFERTVRPRQARPQGVFLAAARPAGVPPLAPVFAWLGVEGTLAVGTAGYYLSKQVSTWWNTDKPATELAGELRKFNERTDSCTLSGLTELQRVLGRLSHQHEYQTESCKKLLRWAFIDLKQARTGLQEEQNMASRNLERPQASAWESKIDRLIDAMSKTQVGSPEHRQAEAQVKKDSQELQNVLERLNKLEAENKKLKEEKVNSKQEKSDEDEWAKKKQAAEANHARANQAHGAKVEAHSKTKSASQEVVDLKEGHNSSLEVESVTLSPEARHAVASLKMAIEAEITRLIDQPGEPISDAKLSEGVATFVEARYAHNRKIGSVISSHIVESLKHASGSVLPNFPALWEEIGLCLEALEKRT